MRSVWAAVTALVAALFATAQAVGSQPVRGRLPLEAFTVAQGLANDSVTAITPDSRGFLWFATLDGLSRYDGSAFDTPPRGATLYARTHIAEAHWCASGPTGASCTS